MTDMRELILAAGRRTMEELTLPSGLRVIVHPAQLEALAASDRIPVEMWDFFARRGEVEQTTDDTVAMVTRYRRLEAAGAVRQMWDGEAWQAARLTADDFALLEPEDRIALQRYAIEHSAIRSDEKPREATP